MPDRLKLIHRPFTHTRNLGWEGVCFSETGNVVAPVSPFWMNRKRDGRATLGKAVSDVPVERNGVKRRKKKRCISYLVFIHGLGFLSLFIVDMLFMKERINEDNYRRQKKADRLIEKGTTFDPMTLSLFLVSLSLSIYSRLVSENSVVIHWHQCYVDKLPYIYKMYHDNKKKIR